MLERMPQESSNAGRKSKSLQGRTELAIKPLFIAQLGPTEHRYAPRNTNRRNGLSIFKKKQCQYYWTKESKINRHDESEQTFGVPGRAYIVQQHGFLSQFRSTRRNDDKGLMLGASPFRTRPGTRQEVIKSHSWECLLAQQGKDTFARMSLCTIG